MVADSLTYLDQRTPRGRRRALSLAALALGLLSGCERPAAEAASRSGVSPDAVPSAGQTRADVERELARRLPLLDLTFAEADSGEEVAPYRLLRFTYRTAGPRRPRARDFGHGLALWRQRDYLPLWYLLHPGDFGPHSLYWTDVNRDGREDLFYLAGEEDAYSTFVYVDRGAARAYSDSAFALAYTSRNDYSSLVDLDGDSTPEILDSGHRGSERVSPAGCADLEIPRRLHGPIAREYRRIAGDFDEANFKFGLSDDELESVEARAEYAVTALRLLHPVKIVIVHGSRARDLTPEFPEHLRWRVGILNEIRKELRAPKQRRCRRTVEAVIKHLRQNVARARRGPWTPPG